MRAAGLLLAILLIFFTTGSRADGIEILANESMPFCGLVGGKPAGMVIDILTAVTRDGGPTFKFDFSTPWPRAQVLVLEQTDLAIVPLTRTPDREANYQWLAELFSYGGHLVTIGRPAPLKTINEARGLEVGVLQASGLLPAVTALGFTRVLLAHSDDVNARRMLLGRLGAWAAPQYVDRYTYEHAGGDPGTLQYGPTLGDEFHLYIAASPKFSATDAKAIDDGIGRLRANGEIEKILERYR